MTPHGSDSTYLNHDCRCDECKRAHAEAQRRTRLSRIRRLAEGTGYQPTHGRSTTYSNWGCRCDDCRAAWAAAAHEFPSRRRASA